MLGDLRSDNAGLHAHGSAGFCAHQVLTNRLALTCCCVAQLHNTHHAAAKVQEAAEGALKDLQLQYLDLWLMHWPVTGNKGPAIEPPIKETWQARRFAPADAQPSAAWHLLHPPASWPQGMLFSTCGSACRACLLLMIT